MRSIKNEPALQRGKSIYVKPKMIELDRNIGHKSVMSIHEFFMDREDLDHLVDQAIHDMQGIGDASDEGVNGMHQFFAADLSVNGAAAL